MKTNILITGGHGFIGKHTCDALRNVDNQLITWDIRPTTTVNTHQFIGHLLNPEIPEQIAEHYKQIDYIIHLAAQISVPESNKNKELYFYSNVLGTQKIIELARRFKTKRIVFASSCSVFGEDGSGTSLNDCKSYYAETKKMSELLLQFSEIETVILQYFNVYGYGQKSITGAAIPNFIDKIRNKQPIDVYGDGNQIRDFVYVKDVAQANKKALTNKMEYENGIDIFEVGTGNFISIKDTIQEIATQLKLSYNCNFLPKRDGDIHGFIAGKDETFDWSPKYSFKDGIKEMIEEIDYDLPKI